MQMLKIPNGFEQASALWYNEHKRDLPWRRTKDPYRIWVSEIMLQQTRVEAVKEYYVNFTKELPSVRELAECPERKLLKLWEGLGYYSRVRNMKKAAQILVDENPQNPTLPNDVKALRALPGIGSYTAGAIASIAFGIREPAVDGNVLRVVMRLAGCREDILKSATKQMTEDALRTCLQKKDAPDAGIFNQALMELGATVCLPHAEPACDVCPVRQLCRARDEELISEIPVRTKKGPRRIEERTVLIIRDGTRTAIRKRPSKGLLAGLYEFPNAKGRLNADEAVAAAESLGLEVLHISPLGDAKHIFSHLEWHMSGYLIRIAPAEKKCGRLVFADDKKLQETYALPSAFDYYRRML